MKIKYIFNKKEYIEKSPKSADFLYENIIGNLFLKIVNKRFLSQIVGSFMNTKLSSRLIKNFIRNNNIDMSDYEDIKYNSFNEFFTRKIKINKRIIDMNKTSLISPADSKLLVYKISDDLKVLIKGINYNIDELFKDSDIIKEYKNGYILIFRLCVDDYHRYSYIDSGSLIKTKQINGILHTVGPIAFKKYKVLKENQREYSIIKTDNFDTIVQMEVGALLIGKIKNYNKETFKKGEEKGYFLFGGSTIVIMIKDIIKINEEILKYSLSNIEVKVRLGEKIGEKK